MRVAVLHESPGADPAAAEFRAAAETFNRGLDIRLRFLDVGFELRVFGVPEDDPETPARIEDGLRSFRPGIVLVLGRGVRLLECAAAVAKGHSPLAFLVDGEADRTTAALARLAEIVVLPSTAPSPAVRPDARTFRIPDGTPAGTSLVDTLVRSVRDGSAK